MWGKEYQGGDSIKGGPREQGRTQLLTICVKSRNSIKEQGTQAPPHWGTNSRVGPKPRLEFEL